MASIEQIRHNLIDKILSIKNEKLLSTLGSILTSNSKASTSFTKEQIEMLKMSDTDIENGHIISQSEIDKMDAEWLS